MPDPVLPANAIRLPRVAAPPTLPPGAIRLPREQAPPRDLVGEAQALGEQHPYQPPTGFYPEGYTPPPVDPRTEAALAETPLVVPGAEGAPGNWSGQPPPQRGQTERALELGVQGVGAGTANLLGTPVDIGNALLNLLYSGLNNVPGVNIPLQDNPVGGSRWISEQAAPVAEGLGLDVLNPAEMTPAERLAYTTTDFGTQAVGGASIVRAAAAARPPAPALGASPRLMDPIIKPYEGANIAGTTARDVAGGVGAGTALWGLDEVTGGEHDPIAGYLAMLFGGAGGSMAYDLPIAGAPAALRTFNRQRTDANVPYDANNAPTTRGTAEDAAAYVQRNAGGPAAAAEANTTLGNVMAETAAMGAPMPPTGQATGNVGLARVENLMTGQPEIGNPIIDRNREVTTWAGGQLRNSGPGADPELFPQVAEGARRANATDNEFLADEMGRFRGLREPAAADIDRGVVDQGLRPVQAQNSALFDAADPTRSAEVNIDNLVDIAGRVAQGNNPLTQILPRGLIDRIEGTTAIPAQTVNGVEIPGREATPVTVRDLVELRPRLQQAARDAHSSASPNRPLGENIRTLLSGVDIALANAARDGDPDAIAFQEAMTNWRATTGQTFGRPGTAAEGLREDFNMDPPTATSPGRGFTPPSQTADRFLRPGQPERADELNRIGTVADAVGPRGSNVAGDLQRAATQFVASFTPAGTNAQGAVDPARVTAFIQEWGSVIDTIPGARPIFDDLAQRVREGADTTEAFNNSAFALVAGAAPDVAVQRLMSAPNPGTAAAELKAQLAEFPGAVESLQQAVGDWFYGRVIGTNAAQTTDGTRPPTLAQVVRRSDAPNTDAVLAEVFSPDQMAALQRVRRVMDFRGILSAAQGTTGSPTASNLAHAFKLFEVGVRTLYGGFRGGNMTRNVKIAFQTLFGNERNRRVVELVARAQTDPRIAEHLLTLDVAPDPHAWASQLGRLMRWAEFSRQANDDWFGEEPDEGNPDETAMGPGRYVSAGVRG